MKSRTTQLLMARLLSRGLLLAILAVPCFSQLNVWQPTGPVHGNQWGYLAVAVDPTNSNVVYTGTYHTLNGYEGIVFKTKSGGPPWTNSSSGLSGSSILQLLIDPSNPKNLLVATYYGSHRLYKSDNEGASWSRIDPPTFGYAWSLKMARTDPRLIFAAGDQLHISPDQGKTWITRSTPNNWDVRRLAVSPFNPNVIFASICEYYDEENCNTRLFRSTDAGLTWSQPVLDPQGDDYIWALEFDPLFPNVIYAAAGDGSASQPALLCKSDNLGVNWSCHSTPGSIIQLEFDPRIPTTMYAVGPYNAAKSIDGGMSWTPFTTGIPPFGPGFQTIDFSSDGRFIHAATSTGVYRVQIREDLPGVARIGGRVTSADGGILRRAIVSIIDARGIQQRSLTNNFGYYAFDNVATPFTQRITVVSKTHLFEARVLQVEGDMSDVDFIGQPIY